MSIDWDDFEKLDIRVGTILCVHDFERAKSLHFNLKLTLEKKLELKNRRPK
jgi:tRNA-binding EMAP/Myf-like protein